MSSVTLSVLATGVTAHMTDLQQQVIEACSERARTASELVETYGVTRWNIYQMARRGYLRNIGHDHGSARYVAGGTPMKPPVRKTKPQWDAGNAIVQATSIWHYAERLR